MFKELDSYELVFDKQDKLFKKWSYILDFNDFQAWEDWKFNSDIEYEIEFCSN